METINRDTIAATSMVKSGKAMTSHVTLADIGMNNPNTKGVFRGRLDLGEPKL